MNIYGGILYHGLPFWIQKRPSTTVKVDPSAVDLSKFCVGVLSRPKVMFG